MKRVLIVTGLLVMMIVALIAPACESAKDTELNQSSNPEVSQPLVTTPPDAMSEQELRDLIEQVVSGMDLQGSQGAKGDPGAQGPEGDKGEAGQSVELPDARSITVPLDSTSDSAPWSSHWANCHLDAGDLLLSYGATWVGGWRHRCHAGNMGAWTRS